MQIENNVGDKIPPWRTPLEIVKQVDVSSPHCIKIMRLVYLKSILDKITKILLYNYFPCFFLYRCKMVKIAN